MAAKIKTHCPCVKLQREKINLGSQFWRYFDAISFCHHARESTLWRKPFGSGLGNEREEKTAS